MRVLEDVFKQLNLSPEHARVYQASLESGPSPASSLAQKAKVPRSTCYGLLYDLIRKGLVSSVKTETKKIFSPESPERLKDLVAEKEKEIERNLEALSRDLPSFETIFESHKPQFPKVRFYEGEDGLKTVYYDSLSADEILIICQGSPETQTSLKDDPSYLKDFIKECALRKIQTRELLEDNPAVQEYKKKYGSKIHQVIITPRNPETRFGHVDKHIYQDKVAYISHDNLVGVIIEDQTLAESERAGFEVLWNYYLTKKVSSRPRSAGERSRRDFSSLRSSK